jgi:alpha-L-glutamate ligase-like protein
VKISHILGLNARARLFSYTYNTPRGKKIAGSKLLTKKYLKRAGVPIPEIYAKFSHPRDLINFDWGSLPSSFALKPNKGLGGEGIIVVKKRAPGQAQAKQAWITTQRRRVTVEDLKLHVLDILEGAFNASNAPDIAYFEEYVGRHKAFRKYAYRGTPDIRVIVFNKVPIMAMLRLPTKESAGRANLHQGAIGVGVDIVTGITTRAIWHGKYIRYKPGTKRKLHGIKIPHWTKVLEMAVVCSEAAGLGYVGVDIVLHPEKGPMVLEINYQPGLQIQLANLAGLKKRLERVEDLEVKDAEHGVKIAKALFAEKFADKVKAAEGIRTVNVFENVKIKAKNGKKIVIPAKIDTGAWRTSVDRTLAKDLGLLEEDNILWEKRVWSSLGREKRPVINITFWLKGKKFKTAAGVSDRSKLRRPLIIGRQDLVGFLVNPLKE